MSTSFLDELAWRGLLHQATDGAAEALAAASHSAYAGFDPTGPSLHVGHLLPVMGMMHLQRHGHRPIALVGGGTGMIGDPSGRSAERNLISLEQVAANAESIRGQLERFLDFSGPNAATMRNNADWLMKISLVEFLREVGKHFSINFMLAKDSVKSRLDGGISYTEFSYMLLQAYDFLELHRRDGVTVQLGGSDQWGNITAGTELIRRSLGKEAHGVTLPLVTTADGKKFGKTAAGTSVWLDPKLTSPYKFFQFWINVDDRSVLTYLRYFTLMPKSEIDHFEQLTQERPELRAAQSALALEVTGRVHGGDAAQLARDASHVIFDRKLDPHSLTLATLELLREEIPYHLVAAADATGPLNGIDLLVWAGLSPSRGDARRQLQQGSVVVNGRKLSADDSAVALSEGIHDRFFLVRKGGRDVALIEIPRH